MRKTATYLLLVFFTLVTMLNALESAASNASKKNFTLVLDAGHGGRDPGCIGAFSKEKNIALSVALEVGRLVESNCSDVHVVYTRKTDVFVDLHRRAQIANNAKADLFISIHVNALPKRRIAYGAETYTLGMARADENLDVAKRENSVILVEDNYKERYAGFNPRSAESYIMFEFMQDQYMKQSVGLARMIQNQYVGVAKRKDKGVHQAGFLVLRETSMPSVLTELGFISTPEEERYMNSKEGIRQLARSIYLGFLNYKKSQEGVNAAPYSEQTEKKREKEIEKEIAGRVASVSSSSKGVETDSSAKVVADTVKIAELEQDQVKEADMSTKKQPDVDKPVFYVQLFASGKKLAGNSPQFKGITPVGHYMEKGLYKYTYGETTNYQEILQLRKRVLDKFPDAFVIALKGGERMDLPQAIREAKKKP
mgnify:CR=1 FL=1